MFISDLARAIGEIQLSKAKPLMMCPAIFDEYPSFMDESQVSLFQLARSANVPIIIAFQGVGFLQNISPAFVEMVLGNCWTHLYCDIRDAQTREFAVKLAGTMIKRFVQESSGSSTGQSYASEQSGLYTNDSEGASSSTGYKATREDILQPEDFASLDQGDGIIVAKSGPPSVIEEQLPERPLQGHATRSAGHVERAAGSQRTAGNDSTKEQGNAGKADSGLNLACETRALEHELEKLQWDWDFCMGLVSRYYPVPCAANRLALAWPSLP
ncbi:TraM recognition domain-containing protein [Pseudomonas aeruginosa]